MSDSDDDLIPNVFDNRDTLHAQLSQTTYGSYNNNMMGSNFNMLHRYDQRYRRRETSPMSLRSVPSSRMHYQQSYSQTAMSSRGSVYNARCRSPMSVRSINSNTSVSATDIAMALKHDKFNRRELQMIHNAYNTYIKSRMQKKICKRRNLKSLLKYCRRNSGGESGADGSDSSLSSDDCRSTRSALCTRNLPRVRERPQRIDLNKLTTQVRGNDIYTDCTESFKQNTFRNLLNGNGRNGGHRFMPDQNQRAHRYPELPVMPKDQFKKPQNAPVVTLKDHLAKDTSLLLPIERFNMSNANPNYEVSYKISKTAPQNKAVSNNSPKESASDNEEIFPPSTSSLNLTQSNTLHQKRDLEEENITYPISKKKKIATSPIKHNKSTTSKNLKKVTANTKDFNFKKPLLPVRKLGTLTKVNEKEILIAKSSQPLAGNVEPLPNQIKEMPQKVTTSEEKLDNTEQSKQPLEDHADLINNNTVTDTTHNSTNVSMKPSFSKRKLFTQKLDIVENKNTSSDNLDMNSPQTKASTTACRDKNKVRKLTSQSCLSRDISDNNYMDLLNKLLPQDAVKNQTLNSTNLANKNENSKSSLAKDGKWDVSLAVSMCDDNKSETFTDEEIFPQKDKAKSVQVIKDPNKNPADKRNQIKTTGTCKVVLQKLKETSNVIVTNNELSKKSCPNKTTVKSCVKSFWDTDFETDVEEEMILSSQMTCRRDQTSSASQFLTNTVKGIEDKKKHRSTILSVRNSCKIGSNDNTQSHTTQKRKGKTVENKENNNENKLNVSRTRSQSSNKISNIQKEVTNNSKNDTNKVSNKSNNDNRTENNKNNTLQKSKPRTPPSKNNKKQSQSIFNISRGSLRLKQKREASFNMSSSINHSKSIEKESPKCNTSRESLRLKQKREAKLRIPKK